MKKKPTGNHGSGWAPASPTTRPEVRDEQPMVCRGAHPWKVRYFDFRSNKMFSTCKRCGAEKEEQAGPTAPPKRKEKRPLPPIKRMVHP